MRDLLVTPQFTHDLKSIPDYIKLDADAITRQLLINPVDPQLQITKLKLNDAVWRIRLGSFRLVYTFNRTSLILLRIRHRKDVYRGL